MFGCRRGQLNEDRKCWERWVSVVEASDVMVPPPVVSCQVFHFYLQVSSSKVVVRLVVWCVVWMVVLRIS